MTRKYTRGLAKQEPSSVPVNWSHFGFVDKEAACVCVSQLHH